jgi:hypothetical protein
VSRGRGTGFVGARTGHVWWHIVCAVPLRLPMPTRLLALRALYVALMLVCAAGLVAAAVLVPAPPLALPAVVVLALGMPMTAAWELSSVVAALRHAGREGRAVAGLRRELAALPETHHPLGF